MPSAVKDLLEKHFGFTTFRPGQENVIQTLLADRSALAVFPTGAGKSLCYQLPALALDGLTLVISPLIALMEDQVGALQSKGIGAERLDSTRTRDEILSIYDRCRSGETKILFIAPERIPNESFSRFIAEVTIDLLAIDEAHCLSEWGHNFRPDYLKLPQLARALKIPRVLCLTATATPNVARDIRDAFGITEEDHVQTSFHRPNLHIHVTPTADLDRKPTLLSRLEATPGESTIVYVTRQETAENVATFLAREGISARAYHAGLAPEVRTEIQGEFMTSAVDVVVATIAFGMGIDKADIRAVYHYNLPKSIENYVQEIGRSGRDGEPAHCEMLACADDSITLENFIYGDTPSPQALSNALDHLLRQGSEFSISRYDLGVTCDIRPGVLATLLTYLEIEGILHQTGPYYAGYKIEKLRELDQILAGHPPEKQQLFRQILQSGKSGWKWTTINAETVADELDLTRQDIVDAVQTMEDQDDIRTQVSHLRHGYRLDPETSAADTPRIAKRLQDLFAQRETQDIARVESILHFTQHPDCLANEIVAYFGEASEKPCGNCTACKNPNHPVPLPRHLPEDLDAAATEVLDAVIAESHSQLRTPRQLARFLCGISSPAAFRARLTRHDHFAALEHLPFLSVLTAAESRI